MCRRDWVRCLGALAMAAAVGGCATPAVTPTAPAPRETVGVLATPLSAEELARRVPAVATREAGFQAALTAGDPLRLPAEALDEQARQAQEVAIGDPRIRELGRDPLTGAAMRTEVMTVRPALPADLTTETAACAEGICYRVDLYNYARNSAASAVVDLTAGEVLAVTVQTDTQPEIPRALTDLAVEIAVNSPEVQAALGGKPGAAQATMPNIKTALNGTQCERSRHLCVAPTFLVGEQALWAVVDLTDTRLVGTRWTDLGEVSGQVVTEASLEDEVVTAGFCERKTAFSRGQWAMDYLLTPSDGLQVSDVRFEDRQVMRSAKLVDWHVSYSTAEGFGYSDATGCPVFSTASVVAFEGPSVEEIREGESVVGFALVQDFRNLLWPQPCNYRYEQRYEFYDDGRYRVMAGNLGRGCGNNGTYRPVLRIDVTAGGDGTADTFAEWDGQAWQPWPTEGWRLQDAETAYTAEGYQYRLQGDGRTWYVEPGQGQFGDGGRGDNAFVYVSRRAAGRDEGESEMLTIGPCCNTDYHQGPEQFLDPQETIEGGADLVLWYVAQLKNDDTPGGEYCWAETNLVDGLAVVQPYPCYFGPMFVPAE